MKVFVQALYLEFTMSCRWPKSVFPQKPFPRNGTLEGRAQRIMEFGALWSRAGVEGGKNSFTSFCNCFEPFSRAIPAIAHYWIFVLVCSVRHRCLTFSMIKDVFEKLANNLCMSTMFMQVSFYVSTTCRKRQIYPGSSLHWHLSARIVGYVNRFLMQTNIDLHSLLCVSHFLLPLSVSHPKNFHTCRHIA